MLSGAPNAKSGNYISCYFSCALFFFSDMLFCWCWCEKENTRKRKREKETLLKPAKLNLLSFSRSEKSFFLYTRTKSKIEKRTDLFWIILKVDTFRVSISLSILIQFNLILRHQSLFHLLFFTFWHSVLSVSQWSEVKWSASGISGCCCSSVISSSQQYFK